jgi:hypothetical protein
VVVPLRTGGLRPARNCHGAQRQSAKLCYAIEFFATGVAASILLIAAHDRPLHGSFRSRPIYCCKSYRMPKAKLARNMKYGCQTDRGPWRRYITTHKKPLSVGRHEPLTTDRIDIALFSYSLRWLAKLRPLSLNQRTIVPSQRESLRHAENPVLRPELKQRLLGELRQRHRAACSSSLWFHANSKPRRRRSRHDTEAAQRVWGRLPSTNILRSKSRSRP